MKKKMVTLKGKSMPKLVFVKAQAWQKIGSDATVTIFLLHSNRIELKPVKLERYSCNILSSWKKSSKSMSLPNLVFVAYSSKDEVWMCIRLLQSFKKFSTNRVNRLISGFSFTSWVHMSTNLGTWIKANSYFDCKSGM